MSEARFPIVGIGASAGGLPALEDLFKTISDDPGMAFVIITHLAPDRQSFLTEILARHTQLPVMAASDDQPVEVNHVYVLPPNASLTIEEGRLRLRQLEGGRREHSPVDVFLASLSADRGEYSVGIVLSGSGHDGVLGVKAIKEHGGLVLAQAGDGAQPGFAEMPDSAIATGAVDFAGPIGEMAARLDDNLRSLEALEALAQSGEPGAGGAGDDAHPDAQPDGQNDGREAICAILRAQTGHDFGNYKKRTFLRRVQRRMQVHACETLAEYVETLNAEPEEAQALFRDLLINVTSFFRDPEAFESLKTQVIPRLFEGRSAADAVRIWVPGCSTGEEVVSIAILLREHMDTLRATPRVTIFATDIDEHALAVARAARYPLALLPDISPARRRRFFKLQGAAAVVAKEVRDLCVFSPHNVLRDPPFSRMDMISCRNLLIYFDAEAQRHLLPIFHYGLRPGGFLFLGKSETIGKHSDLFSVLDKTNCLFQSRDTGSPQRMPIFINGLHPAPFAYHRSGGANPPAIGSLRQSVEGCIAEEFGPAHVVVDEEGDIVYFSSRTSKFLETPSGAPTRQLLTLARRELRLDLRSALRTAIETRGPATRAAIAFATADHGAEKVTLNIKPLPDRPDGHRLFLVVFLEAGEPPQGAPDAEDAATSDDNARANQTEVELRDTRERLQGTIEEYETALEELKSTNEELISLNEELQSSNEELESTKEELQSLNEELQTVNTELCAKIEDLDRANGDLTNLFAHTNVATIFLDRDLVIRSFTPAVAQLLNIIAADRGRPLGDLAFKLDYPELQADIASVLATGTPIERRVSRHAPDSPCYLARLTPYRSSGGAIDGMVATFVDVTYLAKSEEQQRALVSELNHRVKNTLAVIKVVAQQTSANSATPQEFQDRFFARLNALARSHELLSQQNWGEVEIERMFRQALAPFAGPDSQRINLSGLALMLPAALALSFGVILDELATNAAKYGALSNDSGTVAISWSKEAPQERRESQEDQVGQKECDACPVLKVIWRESGGPPAKAPEKLGFGMRLVQREIEHTHSGAVRFDFADSGLSAQFEIPLAPPRDLQSPKGGAPNGGAP